MSYSSGALPARQLVWASVAQKLTVSLPEWLRGWTCLDPSGKWPGRRHSEDRSGTARPPLTRSVGNDEGYQLAASLICVEAATPAARAQCPYSPHGAHTASTHTARTQRPNSTHKAPTPARAERPYSAHAAPTHANTDREYRLAPVSETS